MAGPKGCGSAGAGRRPALNTRVWEIRLAAAAPASIELMPVEIADELEYELRRRVGRRPNAVLRQGIKNIGAIAKRAARALLHDAHVEMRRAPRSAIGEI